MRVFGVWRSVLALVAVAVGVCVLAAGAAVGARADGGHVHALGFDPGDGALLIATHEGLYRLGRPAASPRRIGSVSHDLMSFAVIGSRSYLASGHPDAGGRRAGLPANLGLIRSDDGGRRWRSVSLLGNADFHQLRASKARVVGLDSSRSRLLVSANGGRTWSALTAPDGAVDLAVGPGGEIVASTSDDLLVSRKGNSNFRVRSRGIGPGLVAWPSRPVVWHVDARGVVRMSSDGGATFGRRGSAGGAPRALAAHGSSVAVLVDDGRIVLSRDGGRRFTAVPSP